MHLARCVQLDASRRDASTQTRPWMHLSIPVCTIEWETYEAACQLKFKNVSKYKFTVCKLTHVNLRIASLHLVNLHYVNLRHYVSLQSVNLRDISLRCVSSHCVNLRLHTVNVRYVN